LIDQKVNPPAFLYRIKRALNPRIVRNFQKGIGPARTVLLLTTTGRKSELPRVTPLQYEEINGAYMAASARGAQADWFQNIQANPRVQVRVKGDVFQGTAELVCDPLRIADFFETRLKRHPLMVGLLMRLEGLPLRFNRLDLERFAAGKAIAILRRI
jgi:deazaflavin-dependent oxidoreductase (nitroreductase family)